MSGNNEDVVTSIGQRTRLTGKALTRRGKKLQILRARGIFFFLPVRFSNDIVHGSWWFVLGSVLSIPMAIVPLIDVYDPIFVVPPETALEIHSQAATWILLIIVGVFYTIGSVILVRAFDEPIPEPLLKDYPHFCTDELLGAWNFFFAAIPSLPYAIIYLAREPHLDSNWAMLFGSFLLIAISGCFVYVAYPSRHHLLENAKHNVLSAVEEWFGKDHWMCRHVATDWLASCWFFLFGSLVFMLGTFALIVESENDRQLFIYITSYVDFLFFAVGSAYFVAGSYPRPHEDTHVDYDKDAEHSEGLSGLFNPNYHSDFSSAMQDNRLHDGMHDSDLTSVEAGAAAGSSTGNQYRQKNSFGVLVKTMNQGLGTQIDADVPKDEVISNIIEKYSHRAVVSTSSSSSSGSTVRGGVQPQFTSGDRNSPSHATAAAGRVSASPTATTSSASTAKTTKHIKSKGGSKSKQQQKGDRPQQRSPLHESAAFDEDEIAQL